MVPTDLGGLRLDEGAVAVMNGVPTRHTHRRSRRSPLGRGSRRKAGATSVGEAELLQAARAGHPDALGELLERHRSAGLKRARSLVGRQEAPDLFQEAMTRVLQAIRAGGGPRESFRPYLFRTMRNVHIDWLRRPIREFPVDDVYELSPAPTVADAAAVAGDHELIRAAFDSLPSRWRRVLWLTEVEDKDPREVARILDLRPNAVSALAFRAREGLRGVYLAHHLDRVEDEACRWASERLPRLVRSEWRGREAELVRRHVDDCDRCRGAAATLLALNTHLGAVLAPAVLLIPGLGLTPGVRAPGSRALAGGSATVAAVAFVLIPVGLLGGTGSVDAQPTPRGGVPTSGAASPVAAPPVVVAVATNVRRKPTPRGPAVPAASAGARTPAVAPAPAPRDTRHHSSPNPGHDHGGPGGATSDPGGPDHDGHPGRGHHYGWGHGPRR